MDDIGFSYVLSVLMKHRVKHAFVLRVVILLGTAPTNPIKKENEHIVTVFLLYCHAFYS